jgi:hypothetical protein
MADNDIYDSRSKFEKFKLKLKDYLQPPTGARKTQIKNPTNLKYFKKLYIKLESKDTSYLRRLRLCQCLLLICHGVKKDLEKANREDIDKLLSFSHKRNKTPVSKQDFVKQVKFLWKLLLPEKDRYGRDDETIVPYPVRHLTSNLVNVRLYLGYLQLPGCQYSVEYLS